MAAMRRLLGGHLGASVSALVDGQLDKESTERAWAHVAECPPCRRLVQHEGWVKRRGAPHPRASSPPGPPPPPPRSPPPPGPPPAGLGAGEGHQGRRPG